MNTLWIGNRKVVRRVALVALLIAIVVGGSACSFTDANWLSPEIAGAKAEQLNVDATHQDRVNRVDEKLYEKQVEAQINELARQDELARLEQARRIEEIKQAAEHQEALRQAELANQAEIDRQKLLMLQQQQANAAAEAERRAQLHQQQLAERERQAALEAERAEALTTALFIGLLVLCAGVALAIVIFVARRGQSAAMGIVPEAHTRTQTRPRRAVNHQAYWDAIDRDRMAAENARKPVETHPQKDDNKLPQSEAKIRARSKGNHAKGPSWEKENAR